MSDLDVARSGLIAAALKVTQETWMDTTVVFALCVAATTYADARRAAAPKGEPKPTGVADHRHAGITVPFGRSKGKQVADCDTNDLRWLHGVVQESVNDETKARWREQNVALLNAIEVELEERGIET